MVDLAQTYRTFISFYSTSTYLSSICLRSLNRQKANGSKYGVYSMAYHHFSHCFNIVSGHSKHKRTNALASTFSNDGSKWYVILIQ